MCDGLCKFCEGTRAGKLLRSGKYFLVVAETEPYFADVYRAIRETEQFNGTWSGEDETIFISHVPEDDEEIRHEFPDPTPHLHAYLRLINECNKIRLKLAQAIRFLRDC